MTELETGTETERVTLQARIAQIGADGQVDADEVLTLRREIFRDGVVSTTELDALFALGKRAPRGDREWLQFFAEAAADFFLREAEPRGHLTEDESRDLRGRLGAEPNPLERELLVRLTEQAERVAPAMSGFLAEAFLPLPRRRARPE